MRKLGLLLVLVAGCGSNKITQESGAAACITANACGIYTLGVSSCTQFVVSINDPAVQATVHLNPSEVLCIANAGHDCAAAKKCLAGGNTPASCSGNAQSCAGNVWQACTPAAGSGNAEGMQMFDCGSVGEMCVTNNGNTDCGYGTCSGTAAACVDSSGNPNGNFVQSCNGGILQRTDCSRIDASCNPQLIAHCRGNGPACSKGPGGDTSLRCEGSVLVSCTDGQESRYDCNQDSLKCFAGVDGNSFGCALGTDCDPRNYGASCMGTQLKFCNKGVVQTADCGAAGFSSCNPNGGGSCQL